MNSEDIGPTNVHSLKIVPFSGNDYSLGDNLGERDGTVTKNHAEISSKLSLYFQWHEYAWLGVFVPGSTNPIEAKLAYDLDEIEATVLYLIDVPKEIIERLHLLKKVTIRFEVFRVCFEFTARIISQIKDSPWGKLALILEPPSEIKTFKQRKLPRVKVENKNRDLLPPFIFQSSESKQPIRVMEIGLSSIACELDSHKNLSKGALTFNDIIVPVKIVRTSGRLTVLQLDLSDVNIFGAFFDIYRLVAFPDLRDRNEFSHEEVFSLYERSGYFGQFKMEDVVECKSSVIGTWKNIITGKHSTTADYVIVNSEGQATGASSVALSFHQGKDSFWTFHQLCSIREPSLLASSGHLYTWRAEYLAAHPQPVKGLAWFRSKSRWLERIYIKFAHRQPDLVTLKAAKLVQGIVESARRGVPPSCSFKEMYIGSINRITFWDDTGLVGGFNPTYLNATGVLNHTFSISDDQGATFEQMHLTAREILASKDVNSLSMCFTLHHSDKDYPSEFSAKPSDRLCIFTKESLLDFASSVEHSIAVTRRKLKQ